MSEHQYINSDESFGWSKNNQDEYFESLFKRWYSTLCSFVFRVVKDKEIAQDLVQDVFVKLWEKRDKIEINTSVKSYLYRACMNAALNHVSARKKFNLTNEESVSLSIPDVQAADDGLYSGELQQKINEAIESLPPACKNVFILSRYDELSYKEIADTLQISIKTVENQMGKALKILRVHLSEYLILVFLFLFQN